MSGERKGTCEEEKWKVCEGFKERLIWHYLCDQVRLCRVTSLKGWGRWEPVSDLLSNLPPTRPQKHICPRQTSQASVQTN